MCDANAIFEGQVWGIVFGESANHMHGVRKVSPCISMIAGEETSF